MSLALAGRASADVITVNTTADPVGSGCSGGTCSLRQAATKVNGGPGTGDTITLPAGHYVLSLGLVTFSQRVTISGAGARSTIIDANSTSNVLSFSAGSAPSAVSGVTVTGGRGSGEAGIGNSGSLTVTSTAVVGNAATSSTGGGVYNNIGGVMTIDRSLISGNTASTVGGGVYNKAILAITNSTITDNTADIANGAWEAGGVYNSGTTTIVNSTIAVNTADHGSGVDSGGGTVNFKNTIVAGNIATGAGNANCAGSTFASLGHNLEATSNTCSFNATGDLPSTPADIGALADNGGPTNTRALLLGSAAINHGDNSGCPPIDQRGVDRPQNGTCDIGAYEYAPPAVTTGNTTNRNTAGATVAGTVLPNLREASYHFDYGKTTAYGSASAVRSAGAGASTPVSADLTGLKPNTKIHYRLVATNADGTTVGSDRSFTTSKFLGVTLLARGLIVGSNGRIKLRVHCPDLTAGGSCRTIAALYTKRGKLPASLSKRKAKRLAKGTFQVAAGKTQSHPLVLNTRGKQVVQPGRTTVARVLVTARDSAGNAKTRIYVVKIRRPS